MFRMDAPVRAVHVVLVACRSGQPPVTLRTGGRGAIGPLADFRVKSGPVCHTWELARPIYLHREPSPAGTRKPS
jgi:hypothetical protein